MAERTYICECGKEYIAKSTRSVRCPECQKKKTYREQTIYNREYKRLGRHLNENKRTYTRKVLKNKPREYHDEYVNYCRKNCNTAEGCLNCICPDCLQPTDNDKFLRWEKEEDFHVEEGYIDNSFERYLG